MKAELWEVNGLEPLNKAFLTNDMQPIVQTDRYENTLKTHVPSLDTHQISCLSYFICVFLNFLASFTFLKTVILTNKEPTVLVHTNLNFLFQKTIKTQKLTVFLCRLINFNGLKLNRMNHIKEQLLRQKVNKNIKDCYFQIKVIVKEFTVISAPFKIVSSFSQLPEDYQSKRYSRGSKPFFGKNK